MIKVNNGVISKRLNELTARIEYYLSIECNNEKEHSALFLNLIENKKNLEICINNVFIYNFVNEYTLLDITTREDLLKGEYQIIVQFFKQASGGN